MEYLFKENTSIKNLNSIEESCSIEECFEFLYETNNRFNTAEQIFINKSFNGTPLNESISEVLGFIVDIIKSAIAFVIELVKRGIEYMSFYVSQKGFVKMNLRHIKNFKNNHNFNYYGIDFIIPENSLTYIYPNDAVFTLGVDLNRIINSSDLTSIKNELDELKSKTNRMYYNHLRGKITTGENNVFIEREDYPMRLYSELRNSTGVNVKKSITVNSTIINHHLDYIKNIGTYKSNIVKKRQDIINGYNELLSEYSNANYLADYNVDDATIQELNNYKTVFINKYISHIRKMINITAVAFAQEIEAYKHKVNTSMDILERGIQIVTSDNRKRGGK